MTAEVRKYPFGESPALDLHPEYARLRERGAPVRIQMEYGGEAWLVTRYEDVRFVLADSRFSRAQAAGRDVARPRPPVDSKSMLLSLDPPDHTRLRTLAAHGFTPRRIADLRPRILGFTDDLLDRMLAMPGQQADLAAALAWPLPVTVICDMLGVPRVDQDRLRRWTELTVSLGRDTSHAEITAAREHLQDYLAALIRQRRDHPTDDVLSALVAARDQGEGLSDSELVRLAVSLLIAGHETTANEIANAVYLLLSDRRRWRTLVDNPALIPTAVEELLRFIPIATSVNFARVATEDVILGGQPIRAGEVVHVQRHAANRDPVAFADPEELDLYRTPNPHLAFGYGVHYCLGAPLARLELQVALGRLIARTPTLALAVPAAEVVWRSDSLMRTIISLPVAW